MYEILRLKATDRSNAEQYRDYRLMVKNRLNAPQQVCKRLNTASTIWPLRCTLLTLHTLFLLLPSEGTARLGQAASGDGPGRVGSDTPPNVT